MRWLRGRTSGKATSDAVAIDQAWRIHAALADWTGKVDAKASFALALESAAVLVVLRALEPDGPLAGLRFGWTQLLVWAGLTGLLVAVVLATLAVVPRLRRLGVLGRESVDNFIFFGHLQFWRPVDLERRLRQGDVLPSLTQQVLNMSKIAWRKHRLVQWSLRLGVASGAALAFATVLAR